MQEQLRGSARLAWQVLVSCAANRQTITYSGLASAIGYLPGGERAVGRVLDSLFHYCTAQGLPDITVLVVRADTGRPGGGHDGPPDTDAERERVYAHAWFATAPPNLD